MSQIEYNNLLFEISRRLEELDALRQLLIMCRGTLATSSGEDNIRDVFSLFEHLEREGFLGLDQLGIMKEMLKCLREWALLHKVKEFDRKRKEYVELREQIIRFLEELNDLDWVVSVCKRKIPEASETNIHNVRSLFKELENCNSLGFDCLSILKEILLQTGQDGLHVLNQLTEYEERRNRDEEFESRKAQATAFVSSVGNKLIGVLNIKTLFKVVAGSIITASTLEVWSRGSSFDQLVTAVDRCVLPAGTRLLQITEGCVCLTVQAENLSALRTLWALYQDETLKSRLQSVFVTDELREFAGGEQVEAIVTIDEREYDKACLELNRIASDAASRQEERSIKMVRRNSDSRLYCKARDGEGPTEGLVQPEKPVSGQAKHLHKDAGHELCLKDLSKAVMAELTLRLEGDPVSEELFQQSFALHFEGMRQRGVPVMSSIMKSFPDTPVKLLTDVFEALKLYDLAELLENANPRLLRPALPFKEIRKLPYHGDRPVKFYSKASVLIISDCRNAEDDAALRIGSFFKTLDSRSDVTTIAAAPIAEENLSQVKLEMTKEKEEWHEEKIEQFAAKPLRRQSANMRREAESQDQESVDTVLPTDHPSRQIEHQRKLAKRSEELEEQRALCMKSRKVVPKEIERVKKDLEEEYRSFEMALSTLGKTWEQKEDRASTLFAVFDFSMRNHDTSYNQAFNEWLANILDIIPDAAKVVITGSQSTPCDKTPEALYVVYKTSGNVFAVTLLDILCKRWQALDLVSIMREVQRDLNFGKYKRRKPLNDTRDSPLIIKDSLSVDLRLQRADETSS